MNKYLTILAIAGASCVIQAQAQQFRVSERSAQYEAQMQFQAIQAEQQRQAMEIQAMRFQQQAAQADAFVEAYYANRARR